MKWFLSFKVASTCTMSRHLPNFFGSSYILTPCITISLFGLILWLHYVFIQRASVEGCDTLPVDYSLCTKVRITSTADLPSLTQCDDVTEQTAMCHFITYLNKVCKHASVKHWPYIVICLFYKNKKNRNNIQLIIWQFNYKTESESGQLSWAQFPSPW